ncbi:MAG: putative RDD family membrane protein YckC [Candidatus Azotimanducaceae bacterium]|jgi:uncharacterized RDD family membrane protein YckC
MTEPTDAKASEPVSSAPIVYVGFWQRFLAFLIDSTVASLIMSPLVIRIVGEIDIYDYNLNNPDELLQLLTRLSSQLSLDILFMGTLFILFWVFKNATPGKMLFKCVIVDATTFGPPTVTQNIGRYFGYYLSLIPAGLGFIWVGFDPKKQGWHDKLSNTVVIKGKPRTQLPASDSRQQTPPTSSGEMTEKEALDILRLKDDADKQAIISAHNQMMQKMHPDRGGSIYLATKINGAKGVLVKQRG